MNTSALLAPGPLPSQHAVGLLVSVRSGAEALCALQGGAALIDVKEPMHGALGRASDAVIQEVVQTVGKRCPVSAALGEWKDASRLMPALGLSYVKWGLAGCQPPSDWRQGLATQMKTQSHPQIVLTAYADWECARSPSVEEVFALAQEHPGSVLLLDTHCKEANSVIRKQRPTLLDWLPLAWVADLAWRCRDAHVRLALAGSLGPVEIAALLPARPHWFAVRGAVCEEGDRGTRVQMAKVRQLVDLIHTSDRSGP